MIDVDKFVASLIESTSGINQIIHMDLLNALKAQGLEYKNGEIIKAQRRIAAEAKEAIFDDEDEKLRKAIISIVAFSPTAMFDKVSVSREDVLAWLEQQKEYVSTDFDYVWERTDCGSLTSSLDKYSEEAIKKVCHAWYDKGIELERKSWLKKHKYTQKDVDDAYLKGVTDTKNELEKQCELPEDCVRKQVAEAKEALYDKPTWSEEDEKMFEYALDMIEWYSGTNEKRTKLVSDWLKSLKERLGGK